MSVFGGLQMVVDKEYLHVASLLLVQCLQINIALQADGQI